MTRVVLDTNVFLSAVLFRGELSRLVPYWKEKRFEPLLSKPLFEEYVRALSYPKFKLTDQEIQHILKDHLLPFARTVKEKESPLAGLRDVKDLPVIRCAFSGKAHFLVTGDRDLLEYSLPRTKAKGSLKIVSPRQFLDLLESS